MSSTEVDTTRERILDAAGQVFAAKGFQAATVREICQLAEANIAAINYYFGDKQRLYFESVKRAHDWKIARATLPDWSPDTPAESRLADFIFTFVHRVLSRGGDAWQDRLLMRELMEPDSIVGEIVRDSVRPEFELLLSILRELRTPGVTEEQLHLTAFSTVGQCLHYWFAHAVISKLVTPEEYAGYRAEKLADHITRFCLAALGHGKIDTPLAERSYPAPTGAVPASRSTP